MPTCDPYWTCHACGHYWASPEWPDRCENCRASSTDLQAEDTLQGAEERSTEILHQREAERRRREWKGYV